MAETPEDPEPFSPSIFLDLPPTPPHGDGDDPASTPSHDLVVLPFISRILMEEEEDINGSLLYHQYADDPAALVKVQQPFAQILYESAGQLEEGPVVDVAGAVGLDGDDVNNASAAGLGNAGDTALLKDQTLPPADGERDPPPACAAVEADMLKLAFLKGMEEAKQFLPTSTSTNSNGLLVICSSNSSVEQVKKHCCKNRRCTTTSTSDEDDDESAATERRRRSCKVMVSETEEEADGETVDKMVLNDFHSCLGQMKRLHITTPVGAAAAGGGDEAAAAGGDLHTLLIHCAQAVGTNDRWSAGQLLAQIKKLSSPTGDANQRLAHCFAEGLAARLAGGTAAGTTGTQQQQAVVQYLKAYQVYLEACCFKTTSFTFSNKSIIKAIAGRNKTTTERRKKKVHIVDYGIDYGWQWPTLLRRFSLLEGGPPEVRITGINLPRPGFRPSSGLDKTGRRLTSCARELGVPFRFQSIPAARWETICAEDLDVDPEEVLVVNCLCTFENLADEAAGRDAVLESIRHIRPDVFVLCAMNASHSSPFFVRRFRDALSYYSVVFDMLDATIPRDNQQRLLLERHLFGRCALNVVACEGSDRVERPEPYKQWQVRCQRAGLRQLPLDQPTVDFLRERVRSLYHRDFFVDTDQQWILHGWKGRILYAMSTWVASTPPSS